MAFLTGLVIATLIITGVYVGYHAYEASLHEEVEKHTIPIEVEKFQIDVVEIIFNSRPDQSGFIL